MKRRSTYRPKKKTQVLPDDNVGDKKEVDSVAESVETPKKKDDTRPVPVVKRVLKNIYDTRVIVGADRTPSGKRYEFEPGQQKPVEPEDYHFLLSLNRNPGPGCCGGTPAEQAQRHYFGLPD